MPRKGENIYKRKDGRWEGRYVVAKKSSGKIIYKSVYGHSYLEAKQKLSKAKYEHHHNIRRIIVHSNTLTISAASHEWLNLKKAQIKESSFIKYSNIVETYIVKNIGMLKISEMTADRLELFIHNLLRRGGRKQQSLSAKTVSDIVSVFKRILQYAVRKYQMNICDLTGLKIRMLKKPIQVFSSVEYKKLVNYLLQHMSRINTGILLALFTGIRIGELCALRCGNIILDESALVISETLQRIQTKSSAAKRKTKIIITAPKSLSSLRKIPLPSLLMPLLVQICASKDSFLLTGMEQKFIEPRTVQNHFHRILQATHIMHRNFHALRHTFATQCLSCGMDIKSLSEILGHANINITLNKYVHPSFEEKKQSMDKLSDLLTVK